ncbi:MAG: hypothetical protein QXD03_03860 [Candidatus Anstonellales archaeon]
MMNELRKKDGSFVKATTLGVGSTILLAFGGALYGIGKIFDMFKR